jgi:protein-L-isoaspartate O-methyltransferase
VQAKLPPEPLSYYYFGGPISQTIDAVRAVKGGLRRVAAVGLGSGSLACHRHGGEAWTFYEIDPEVVRIASRFFSFLSNCAPDVGIVMGDARLTLAAARQRYDMIIIDAFSSDAIPVHLMTREAVAGYLSRLEDDGVLVVHISNRHMELGRVVAAVGAAEGLVTYFRRDDRPNRVSTRLQVPSDRHGTRTQPCPSGQSDAGTRLERDQAGSLCAGVDRRLFGYCQHDHPKEVRPLTAPLWRLGELAQHRERLNDRGVPHLRPADVAEATLAMDQSSALRGCRKMDESHRFARRAAAGARDSCDRNRELSR